MVWCGEDAVVVGVDVVEREEDGLGAAPKDVAEERVHVVRVGEDDRQQPETDAVTILVEAKHLWRARWEVAIAGGMEVMGELDGPPPFGMRPHTERVLHENARRVAALPHGTRPKKGRSVELHLGKVGGPAGKMVRCV